MSNQDSDPKLRHEFVGMMFAVTIAEVGLQIAALVQAGHFVSWIHFLPEYAHLLLATVVVAASWVGWTLSVAPGARHDVNRIFQWEFLVLLLDVALVILYFILVRSVDFEKEQSAPHTASASKVGITLCWIFFLYILWDILTKVIIFVRDREQEKSKKWFHYYDKDWWRKYGSRMLPALLCLVLAGTMTCLFQSADRLHLLTADLAFLALVLLFRALKEVISAVCPTEHDPVEKKILITMRDPKAGVDTAEQRLIGIREAEDNETKAKEKADREARQKWIIGWTALCVLVMGYGLLSTMYSWRLPLCESTITDIKTEPSDKNSPAEPPPPAGRHEQPDAGKKP